MIYQNFAAYVWLIRNSDRLLVQKYLKFLKTNKIKIQEAIFGKTHKNFSGKKVLME